MLSTTSFRDILKTSTRAAHDDVDRAFAAFDLSTDAGYLNFLRSHRQAMARLEARAPASASVAVTSALDRIDTDLSNLRQSGIRTWSKAEADDEPTTQHQTSDDLHEMAVDYVLLGARFGMAVLRQRHLRSPGAAKLASNYLAMPVQAQQWAALCVELAAVDAASAEAAVILRDVLCVFNIFKTAALTQAGKQAHVTT